MLAGDYLGHPIEEFLRRFVVCRRRPERLPLLDTYWLMEPVLHVCQIDGYLRLSHSFLLPACRLLNSAPRGPAGRAHATTGEV